MENETTWYKRRTSAKAYRLAEQLGIKPLYGSMGPFMPGDSIGDVADFLKLEIPFMMKNFFYLSALPNQ